MDDTGHPFHEQVNPRVLHELRVLLDAFADQVEPLLRKAAKHDTGELPATCHWCPLCAAVAVVRGQRPELAARAAEQGVVLVDLLRALLGEQAPANAPGARSWTTSGHLHEDELIATRPQPVVRERVERIEVRRAGQRSAAGRDLEGDREADAESGAEASNAHEQAAEDPASGERVQRITVRRRGRDGGKRGEPS